MSIPRILVSVPNYHAVEPYPFIHFLILSQETGRAELEGRYAVCWMVGGPKVKIIPVREGAVRIAQQKGCSHLLQIDDDMVCPQKLIDHLLADDVDIVVPLFFTAGPPIKPLCFESGTNGRPVPIWDYPKKALFECSGGVGTGVMLVKMEVFKAMESPYFRPTLDLTIGEDIDFCRRAMLLGFKCWCDSRILVRQMACQTPIGEEDYSKATWGLTEQL
jgi:hypothetical protein